MELYVRIVVDVYTNSRLLLLLALLDLVVCIQLAVADDREFTIIIIFSSVM